MKYLQEDPRNNLLCRNSLFLMFNDILRIFQNIKKKISNFAIKLFSIKGKAQSDKRFTEVFLFFMFKTFSATNMCIYIFKKISNRNALMRDPCCTKVKKKLKSVYSIEFIKYRYLSAFTSVVKCQCDMKHKKEEINFKFL